MLVNKGRKNEVAVRVVCESESYGREYSDYGSLERCMGGLIRMAKDAIECAGKDGVSRVVGIALIPRSDYGDQSGYCPDFEDGEHRSNVPFAAEPASEGIAAMEILAGLDHWGQPLKEKKRSGSPKNRTSIKKRSSAD
jgi:hypothetical protein